MRLGALALGAAAVAATVAAAVLTVCPAARADDADLTGVLVGNDYAPKGLVEAPELTGPLDNEALVRRLGCCGEVGAARGRARGWKRADETLLLVVIGWDF